MVNTNSSIEILCTSCCACFSLRLFLASSATRRSALCRSRSPCCPAPSIPEEEPSSWADLIWPSRRGELVQASCGRGGYFVDRTGYCKPVYVINSYSYVERLLGVQHSVPTLKVVPTWDEITESLNLGLVPKKRYLGLRTISIVGERFASFA